MVPAVLAMSVALAVVPLSFVAVVPAVVRMPAFRSTHGHRAPVPPAHQAPGENDWRHRKGQDQKDFHDLVLLTYPLMGMAEPKVAQRRYLTTQMIGHPTCSNAGPVGGFYSSISPGLPIHRDQYDRGYRVMIAFRSPDLALP
jgi:hypothetical protein